MSNNLHFCFKAEDIKTLIDKGAFYFVASSHIEEDKIKKVFLFQVTGEGYNRDNKLIGSVRGCPCPPCNPGLAETFSKK